MRRQLGPHLVDRPRRREDAVFFAKALQAILRRIDAPDVRDERAAAGPGRSCRALRRGRTRPASNSSLKRSMSSSSFAGDLAGRVLQREQQQSRRCGSAAALCRCRESSPSLRCRGVDDRGSRSCAEADACDSRAGPALGAERKGHRAVRDDACRDARVAGQHAHSAAQALDQRFDLDHVAGVHRAAIANAFDAHEERSADRGSPAWTESEWRRPGRWPRSESSAAAPARPPLAAGDKIALVERHVLDADDPLVRLEAR